MTLSKKKVIIIVVVILLLIVASIFIFKDTGKEYVTELIGKMVEDHLTTIEQNYVTSNEVIIEQIEDIQNRLNSSEKTYYDLRKRIDSAETEIQNRKPPTTSEELRSRFIALGYHPVE